MCEFTSVSFYSNPMWMNVTNLNGEMSTIYYGSFMAKFTKTSSVSRGETDLYAISGYETIISSEGNGIHYG